jgi:hypothetical protein
MKSSIITDITAVVLFSLVMLLLYAVVQETYHIPKMQLTCDIASDIRYERTYNYILDRIIELWIKESFT